MKNIISLFFLISSLAFASEETLVKCTNLSTATETGIELELRGDLAATPPTYGVEVRNSSKAKAGVLSIAKCTESKTSENEAVWIKCTTIGTSEISIYDVDLRMRISKDNGGTSRITLKYVVDGGKDMERLTLTGKDTDCTVSEF